MNTSSLSGTISIGLGLKREVYMGLAMHYRNEIISLSKKLSEHKLKEVIDFAHFLKAREEGVTLEEIRDSAEYVRKMRLKEGKRIKSGEKFIEELIQWQKSNY